MLLKQYINSQNVVQMAIILLKMISLSVPVIKLFSPSTALQTVSRSLWYIFSLLYFIALCSIWLSY